MLLAHLDDDDDDDDDEIFINISTKPYKSQLHFKNINEEF